jgi:hypothetical protein
LYRTWSSGGLISFIGYFLLNNIVNAQTGSSAAQILMNCTNRLRSTLKQDQEGATGRDGMDIALCIIDQENQILDFAGAHRPLYLMRNGELNEYQGSRKAIGGIPLAKKIEKDFENHVINYQKEIRFSFLVMDYRINWWFRQKKIPARRIRETLIENPDASMAHFPVTFQWISTNGWVTKNKLMMFY